MSFVSELEPNVLWQHFDEILKIPRGSKNEAGAREYVIQVAQRCGLEYHTDKAGNLVVRKPARSGFEKSAGVVLQCHLDMVNEKNSDVRHDFFKDPIQPVRDGSYLKAAGTTLGSDNGIGVAASLAVLNGDTLKHGSLECLFTVDEETGLTGAANLDPSLLQGTRLINLDSEEEGTFYVGCAGGAGLNLSLPLTSTPAPSHSSMMQVKLHGLRGGHSGVDIHLQRGNAIQLLARTLYSVSHQVSFQLADFSGGNMHNAIPREAFATIAVEQGREKDLENSLHPIFAAMQTEFRSADPDMKLTLSLADSDSAVLDPDTTKRVLRLLNALPHGVQAMSPDIPDLVETSANLATARTEGNVLLVHCSNRSSVESALQAIQQKIEAIARLAGAEVEWLEGYPGWRPDLDSSVLQTARRVYRRLFERDPQIKAIHAGLECGIIKEKYPEMDMVSVGPQIESPHSPDERVKIDSVEHFYRLLTGILEELATSS